MTLTIETEIRKMPPSNTRELVQILEYNESWKRLMAIIPKKLDLENYKAELKLDNLPKYNTEHFRLIENAADKLHRACAEILLDEWGTSGRIRPALGHLLFLLKKAELYRAADFIAVKLLNMEPPERPKEGPAAPVTVNFIESGEIEEVLNGINYNSTDLAGNTIENNLDEVVRVEKKGEKSLRVVESKEENESRDEERNKELVIPQIVVTDITECFKVPVVVPRSEVIPVVVEQVGAAPTDLIKFSTNEIKTEELESGNLPDISALNLHTDQSNSTSTIIDNSSGNLSSDFESSDNISPAVLQSSETNIPAVLNSSSAYLPAVLDSSAMNLPAVLENTSFNLPAVLESSSGDIPAVLESSAENMPAVLQSSATNLPAVLESSVSNLPAVLESSNGNSPAILQSSVAADSFSESNLPAFSQIMPSEPNMIPQISKLLHPETTNEIPSSPVAVTESTHSRPTCSSPLPNLSLNTLLPQFSYSELEVATNNFDETPHKNSLEMENSLDESNGRFLGAGAFGSVYLALGLLGKPIAVKKLYLNSEEVNVDDVITKQFRNEVEVLSKYKHENLLSICGYSCDGPTYCLMYDYISGGALNCRLEKYKEELQWKERLRIALGTAEAVAYLHTAFATPLIHRDIKTANILLDCSNKPKLGDFGIIKLSPNQNTTISTTIIGTSVYMAPEAFRSGDVSVKIDSFSFGVVILELLTALPPLDEKRESIDLISHVEEVCEESIEPLLDLSAGNWMEDGENIGEGLFEVANKCLEEKKRRPNMVEVREMLKKLVKD